MLCLLKAVTFVVERRRSRVPHLGSKSMNVKATTSRLSRDDNCAPSTRFLDLSQSSMTQEESFAIDKISKLPVLDSILKDSRARIRKNLPPRTYDNLFKIITCPRVLTLAYSNLHLVQEPVEFYDGNKGPRTPGYRPAPATSGSSNGMSNFQLYALRTSMVQGTWKPLPVKQMCIPKLKKSAKHALGLPNFNDKLIGEVLRMVLHAIYEPHFEHLNANFGFRPQCSNHDCLKDIQFHIPGKQYVIKGGVKALYSSLDHKILMHILRKRIMDRRFLQLIQRLLKAGIFHTLDKSICSSLGGVPEGQILSPILWNIYFHEFDLYVLNDLPSQMGQLNIEEDQKNKSRTPLSKTVMAKLSLGPRTLTWSKHPQGSMRVLSTGRRQVHEIHSKYTLPYDTWSMEDLHKRQKICAAYRNLKSIEVFNPSANLRRKTLSIHYRRYADDWIIFTNLSKEKCVSVKQQLSQYLVDTLKLTLDPVKTNITNLSIASAPFVGFSIGYYPKPRIANKFYPPPRTLGVLGPSEGRRGRKVHISPDHNRSMQQLIVKKYALREPSGPSNQVKGKNLKSRALPSMTIFNLPAIFNHYNSILRCLYNDYLPIITSPNSLKYYAHIITYSCFRTICRKYKITLRKLAQKNGSFTPLKITLEGSANDLPVTLELLNHSSLILEYRNRNKDPKPDPDIFDLYKRNYRSRRNFLMRQEHPE